MLFLRAIFRFSAPAFLAVTMLLSTPVWANGSASFSGTVTSTDGGFVFPDGSIQASACIASERFVFLGISKSGFSGSSVTFDSGLRVLDERCQDEISPESRMCFSSEIVATSVWPTTSPPVPTTHGVFRPEVRFVTSSDLHDASGITATLSETFNCDGWSQEGSGFKMPGVTIDGQFQTLGCLSNSTIGVACCGPAPD